MPGWLVSIGIPGRPVIGSTKKCGGNRQDNDDFYHDKTVRKAPQWRKSITTDKKGIF